MKKLFVPIIIAAIVVLTACNPLNKKYSDKNFADDAKAIVDSKKLSEEDTKMLAGYIVFSKMGNINLEGKTYADILSDAKKMKADQEAKEAKEKKEEMEKKAKLTAALTAALNVTLLDKGTHTKKYTDYLDFKIAIENKSGKEIKSINGTLEITNLSGTSLKTIFVIKDYDIQAGETIKDAYSLDYEEFDAQAKEVKAADLKNLKAIWTAKGVVFSDGTKLELPNADALSM